MRPVHDSNGVYRFVICVQLEASAHNVQRELYASVLSLLPWTLEVGDAAPCGPVHSEKLDSSLGRGLMPTAGRRSSFAGKVSNIKTPTFLVHRERLAAALSGKLPDNRAADVRDSVRFSTHHAVMEGAMSISRSFRASREREGMALVWDAGSRAERRNSLVGV